MYKQFKHKYTIMLSPRWPLRKSPNPSLASAPFARVQTVCCKATLHLGAALGLIRPPRPMLGQNQFARAQGHDDDEKHPQEQTTDKYCSPSINTHFAGGAAHLWA